MNVTPGESTGVGSGKYRAFISYSQAADGRLAPALQTGLQRFSKPWYRRHALRVFRDSTGLSVTPELWGSIERGLRQSDYFILLASPLAAQSKWVEQEVDWWLRHRSAARLLVVLTDGDLVWDPAANDFDWTRTTALSRRFEKAFSQEPLFLDLRWARRDTDLSLRQPRFAEAVANLSATLRGQTLDELTGEDVRQHERTIRLLRVAAGVLMLLTVCAMFAAFLAIQARNTAERVAQSQATNALVLANEAKSRKLAGLALSLGADAELQTLLAAEALRLFPTVEAESALRGALFASLEPVLTLTSHSNEVNLGIFSPDGSKILTFGDSVVRLCDASSGELHQVFPHGTNEVYHAAFNRDGRRIVTSSGDGMARIWETATGKILKEFTHENVIGTLLSADETRLLTLGSGSDAILWDTISREQIADFNFERSQSYSDHIREASFSADGSRVALCMRQDPAVIEAKSGRVVLWLTGHSLTPRSVDFSPDGNWLITASDDKTTRRWSAATGKAFATWRHETEIYEARFSPDGKRVAIRDADSLLSIWDAETGRKLAILEPKSARQSHLIFEFSPSGKCLLTSTLDASSAEIWDASTGTRLAEIIGPAGEIRSLRFSPDSKRALVGAYGAPVRVFPCEVCGTAADLLEYARTKVPRTLTEQERAKYVEE